MTTCVCVCSWLLVCCWCHKTNWRYEHKQKILCFNMYFRISKNECLCLKFLTKKQNKEMAAAAATIWCGNVWWASGWKEWERQGVGSVDSVFIRECIKTYSHTHRNNATNVFSFSRYLGSLSYSIVCVNNNEKKISFQPQLTLQCPVYFILLFI